MRVFLARVFDQKMAPRRQWVVSGIRLVPPDQTWFNKCTLHIEGIRLVKHGLNEALNCVLGRTVWTKTWDTQSPRGRAEN